VKKKINLNLQPRLGIHRAFPRAANTNTKGFLQYTKVLSWPKWLLRSNMRELCILWY